MRPVALLLVALTAAETAVLTQGCPRPPALGEPLRGLTAQERSSFQAGQLVFEREFTPAEGLGPLFNAVACGECHEDPVIGGHGDESETHAARLDPTGLCDPLASHGGPVFQSHATPALQAALGIDHEEPPAEATVRATRTSPDVFGMGLLEAVPDRMLVALSDPDDRDRDGISGRAHLLPDGRVGRFGRKASVAGLDEFTAGAFVIEMGITNPGALNEESIGGAPIPAGVDPTPEPELPSQDLAAVIAFMRFLAPPPPLDRNAEASHGAAVFSAIGCVSCHVPSLRTGASPSRTLAYRTVHAYSDLLLHDMGAARADICLGVASPAEFRTQPLMGLRLQSRFLHDGAALTPEAAILLHAGEADASRTRFERLPARERAALLTFLGTL